MPELLAPLAHHPLLEALPFFGPVFLIGTALLVLAIRARRYDDPDA